jgi:hypothetical protein
MHHSRGAAGLLASLVLAAGGIAQAHEEDHGHHGRRIQHVLLISVDGLHSVDLARCTSAGTCPALARLSEHAVTYTNAFTTEPSDSFPGLLSMLTGGTPKTTGVYYDDSFDRSLFAPGSRCAGSPGTEVAYAENLDTSLDFLNGGVPGSFAGNSANAINPALLPRAKVNGQCAPVWPHNFLRVNTLFGVLHRHGLRTAWTDKHPAYDLVNGPDGHNGPGTNVDDFFAPEINSAVSAENVALITKSPPAGLVNPDIDFTGSIQAVQFYDGIKVGAILNQIRGLDHAGKRAQGTPALFGMNFQAVSVGQKLPGNGYVDSRATPSVGLASSIAFVDRSIGSFIEALDARGLRDSTLIILSAKHGQSPIDPARFTRIPDGTILTPAINAYANDDAFHIADDAVLEWLEPSQQGDTNAVIDSLIQQQAAGTNLGIGKFYSGAELVERFGDPTRDPRVPDFILAPNPGVVYANKPSKISEHGGFTEDDTHVALLVANPAFPAGKVAAFVHTTQIAPSILEALGFDGNELQAVRAEGTQALPGFDR